MPIVSCQAGSSSNKVNKMAECDTFNICNNRVFVFDGKNFIEWASAMRWQIQIAKLLKFIVNKEEAMEYKNAIDLVRMNDLSDYGEGNTIVLGLLMNGLSPRIMRRIIDSETTYKMWHKSRNLYLVRTNAAEDDFDFW